MLWSTIPIRVPAFSTPLSPLIFPHQLEEIGARLQAKPLNQFANFSPYIKLTVDGDTNLQGEEAQQISSIWKQATV